MSRLSYIPNSELSLLLDDYIKSERDRKILKDSMINGIKQDKIAEKYELSVRRVQQIIRSGADVIAKIYKN